MCTGIVVTLIFWSSALVAGNPQLIDSNVQNARQSKPIDQIPSLDFRPASNQVPQKLQCPEVSGYFHDTTQCDKFWRCENGVATSHLCADGLVFYIEKADGRDDPCDSPYVVDCEDRWELQSPTFPSEFCPRAHGSFEHPDPTVCNTFYICIKGLHTEVKCTPGLYFNETTGICNWPELSGRENCKEVTSRNVHKSGFTCPNVEVTNSVGVRIQNPLYPNESDCRKFFICLHGVDPREAACDLGQVFDEVASQCDYPENVPECSKYYEDDPRFKFLFNADGKIDIGTRRDISQSFLN